MGGDLALPSCLACQANSGARIRAGIVSSILCAVFSSPTSEVAKSELYRIAFAVRERDDA
jgi:hypothetical protein